MCSFDWEKWLLFIYSTWEKECAPSLKRVEKPLWRKKDPCTTTRDIDYHCSYWHVTLCTCVITEQWHVTLNTSVINVEENNLKILYSVLWAYLRLCTCPSRKRGHCKKHNMDSRKYVEIIWSAWIPSHYSGDFFFSSVFWVNAHYIHVYQVQDKFFVCVCGCFYQNPRKK